MRDLSRAVDRYRRLLAALFAAMCVLSIVSATSSAQTPTTEVLTTSREVPAGTTLTEADVVIRPVRSMDVPERAVTSPAAVLGKVTGSPLTRGSMLTELSVISGRASSAPGRVLIAVKVTDPDMARLVAPGMRVALLAPGASGGLVTDDALVVATPQAAAPGPLSTGGDSRTLLVDVEAHTAERMVKVASTAGITVALR